MAGAGYKLFNTGDVLTAAQVNTYLQEQVVMVFANATARTTALSGVLAEGMMSYLQDTNAVEVYDGSAWVSVGSTGDITGVTAGTGISGGGSSGTVTITNSMATAIDAKGDLIVGTGADTFSRLAVGGTNGHVLTVDSGESTGMKWAAVSGAAFTGVSVTKTANQTISNTTSTIITWESEEFDTNSYHDNSTNNSRITIPSGKGGYYQINLIVSSEVAAAAAARLILEIRKNGSSTILQNESSKSANGGGWSQLSGIVNLAAADYLEVRVWQNSGGNLIMPYGSGYPIWSISYLGA